MGRCEIARERGKERGTERKGERERERERENVCSIARGKECRLEKGEPEKRGKAEGCFGGDMTSRTEDGHIGVGMLDGERAGCCEDDGVGADAVFGMQVVVNIIIGVIVGLIFYRVDQHSDVTKMVSHPAPNRPLSSPPSRLPPLHTHAHLPSAVGCGLRLSWVDRARARAAP